MSHRALKIGKNDQVITTPFTYFATSEAISLVGAQPVFADINPHTFNINPKRLEKLRTDSITCVKKITTKVGNKCTEVKHKLDVEKPCPKIKRKVRQSNPFLLSSKVFALVTGAAIYAGIRRYHIGIVPAYKAHLELYYEAKNFFDESHEYLKKEVGMLNLTYCMTREQHLV